MVMVILQMTLCNQFNNKPMTQVMKICQHEKMQWISNKRWPHSLSLQAELHCCAFFTFCDCVDRLCKEEKYYNNDPYCIFVQRFREKKPMFEETCSKEFDFYFTNTMILQRYFCNNLPSKSGLWTLIAIGFSIIIEIIVAIIIITIIIIFYQQLNKNQNETIIDEQLSLRQSKSGGGGVGIRQKKSSPKREKTKKSNRKIKSVPTSQR